MSADTKYKLENNLGLINMFYNKFFPKGTNFREDILQIMYLTYLSKLRSFDPTKGSIGTYMERPLFGAAISEFRRLTAPVSFSTTELSSSKLDIPYPVTLDARQDEEISDPDRDFRIDIDAMMKKHLTELERGILIDYVLRDRGVEYCTTKYHISRNSMWARYYSGIKKLREALLTDE